MLIPEGMEIDFFLGGGWGGGFFQSGIGCDCGCLVYLYINNVFVCLQL